MEYVVVKDYGLSTEEIHYTGTSEVEAFRRYKKLMGLGQRNIFKAKVKKIHWHQVEIIDRYDVLEVIR